MKKELIPVLILIIASIYCIIIINITNTYYSNKQCIGHILVFVSFASFFINKKAYDYLIIATLLLGIVGVINFTPSTYIIDIFGLKLNPLSFLVALIFIFIKKK